MQQCDGPAFGSQYWIEHSPVKSRGKPNQTDKQQEKTEGKPVQASFAGSRQEAQDKSKGNFRDEYEAPLYNKPLGLISKGTLLVQKSDNKRCCYNYNCEYK